jgi:hypothetical protein
MQARYFLIAASVLLSLLMLSGCGRANGGYTHEVIFEVLDTDVGSITFSSCSSKIELPNGIQLWKYTHVDCPNSDYSIIVIYTDGVVVEQSLGYIPGGVDITHYFLLEQRELSLRDWVPELQE